MARHWEWPGSGSGSPRMGNPEMTTTIATRHRCQPVNATTWRVEFCNGKRWELVAMIERADTGRYRRRGTNDWGRVRLCDCVAELVARFLEVKTQGEFMSEQIDYTWRPDGFPPAEAGWYYPKDGVRMAGDVWINKRHNGQIERGSELHARGFNIGNSVNICSEWVQRRIPTPVAESKGENAATPPSLPRPQRGNTSPKSNPSSLPKTGADSD